MKRLDKGKQKRTPYMRLVATEEKVLGKVNKKYTPDGITRFCNFSTYGGTERDVNGLIVVEGTAQIIAWYEPDITSADHIRILTNGNEYEILGTPEDIELSGQEMTFKVRRVKGGA